MTRVGVTGIGAVSPFGIGVDALWDGCLRGTSQATPIPENWHTYHKFRSKVWAALPELDFKALGFGSMEILKHDPV
jgi:3-oxoacyl-(acyl-carrier-protein) synthase